MIFTYILIGGTILGVLMGYNKGLLKQVSSLLGLFIGYSIATLFLTQTHQFFIDKEILSELSSTRLSFILTIGIAVFSVKFLAGVIENALKSIGLNFTNQWAGAIFGGIKYFLVIILIYCFLYTLEIIKEDNSSESLRDFISLFKAILLQYIKI